MSSRPGSQPLNREAGSGARNLNEKICLIVNPRAGAGRAGRELDVLRAAADRAFAQWEVRETTAQGHASLLAAEAVADGFDLVAAVGGDGTCHEVVNGLMDGRRARSRKCAFTVIPFGTGSDLIRTLRIPRGLGEALWVAATGITLPTDLGVATVTGPDGPKEEIFVNVAGFGANGDVVKRANAMDKRMGGTLTFLRATAQMALSYRPSAMQVSWEGPDGPGSFEGPVYSGFVANGAWCGGGMWVGRGGTMQDGHFDLTLLPPLSMVRQIVNGPMLYTGHLDRLPGVRRVRATSVCATAPQGEGVFIDLDGEMPGCLPARFEVLSRALQIRGGWTENPLLNT